MDDVCDYAGKTVVVMGLGRFGGGIGTARYFAERGCRTIVTDTAPAEKLAGSLERLAGLEIEYHLGGHVDRDFTDSDLVVVSPAVPDDSPWLALARRSGVPVTTEMNLFFRRCAAPITGITGSNGKSTTTAMIHAVLSRGGRRVWLGGNIGGESLLARVDEIGPEDRVVLELSSFQLERLEAVRRSPHIAVVTNIAPNHLDRHGSMANYRRAKQVILKYQQRGDTAILCAEDPELRSWSGLTGGRVIWYPADPVEPEGIELAVPGRHNRLNASAALAVGRVLGVDEATARQALAEFRGLAHRLELVAEHDGVRYYNDSIATTPESVMAAIDAFDCPKTLILGGYDKKVSFEALAEKIVADGRVEQVVVLGQVRQALQGAIEAARARQRAIRPEIHPAVSLEQAVELAARFSKPGSVVALSPGCASYDMFVNFEQRGEVFRRLAAELAR